MRKLFCFLMVFALLLIPSFAFSGDYQFYIGPKAGATFLSDQTINIGSYGSITRATGDFDLDPNIDFGLKAGLNFEPLPEWLFLEYELGYYKQKGDFILNLTGTFSGGSYSGKVADIDVDVIYNNFNLIFEPTIENKFKPYGGVGLSINYVDAELDLKPIGLGKESDDDVAVGLNLMGGIKIKTPIGWLFAEGKYIYSEPKFYGETIDLEGASAVGGILWYFGSKK